MIWFSVQKRYIKFYYFNNNIFCESCIILIINGKLIKFFYNNEYSKMSIKLYEKVLFIYFFFWYRYKLFLIIIKNNNV